MLVSLPPEIMLMLMCFTETCIPLYDLQDAGERIYGSGEVSWLDAYSEPQVTKTAPPLIICCLSDDLIFCTACF